MSSQVGQLTIGGDLEFDRRLQASRLRNWGDKIIAGQYRVSVRLSEIPGRAIPARAGACGCSPHCELAAERDIPLIAAIYRA